MHQSLTSSLTCSKRAAPKSNSALDGARCCAESWPIGLSTMTPELELLRHCARPPSAPAVPAHLDGFLDRGIDWARFHAAAEYHAVLALAHRALRDGAIHAVPAEALARLWQQVLVNTKRNGLLTRRLGELVTALAGEGVRSLPYKGPLLALTAYGNVARRQFTDLDILVSPADVTRCRDVLTRRGYTARSPEEALNSGYLDRQRELQLADEAAGVLVELHWRVAPHWQLPRGFAVEFEPLWQRAETITVSGTEMRSLAPDDLLLILCVHATSHQWFRLQLVADVAWLLHSRRDIDTERLRHTATRLGAGRMLSLGLALARDVLGASLPASLDDHVRRSEHLQQLESHVLRWLDSEAPAPIPLFDEMRFHLGVRERLRDKLAYAPLYLRALGRAAWG